MKKLCIIALLAILSISTILAADTKDEKPYVRAGGVSAIAPGLPVAAKYVYQDGMWGWQAEFNYFYLLGMGRIDGRKIVKGGNGTDVYGFVGISINHFNHYTETPAYMEFVLSADVGIGAEWKFSKHMALGVEGGLMIPFWCNTGLDQFDNSGLMVANVYLLYWF